MQPTCVNCEHCQFDRSKYQYITDGYCPVHNKPVNLGDKKCKSWKFDDYWGVGKDSKKET